MTYAPLDGAAVGDEVTLLGPAGVHPAEELGRPDRRRLRPAARRPSARRRRGERHLAAGAAGTRHAQRASAPASPPGSRSSTPSCRSRAASASASSPARAWASPRCSAISRAASRPISWSIALIGERGRELRDFVDNVLGPKGMARAVVIAATSDQAPLIKRRAAWMAMATAEVFRDQGRHVLLLLDSLTRFAEAHREIALTAGEAPSLRGFPPSTANLIASLCERAGPGPFGKGDITGVFSVLVAASDMDEPIADITRGVLDGHVVLDRGIAERGRFPAIDVRRSVSRSLPRDRDRAENAMLARLRRVLTAYENAALMIQTGLYVPGSDPASTRRSGSGRGSTPSSPRSPPGRARASSG